jgi:hypothetical protein
MKKVIYYMSNKILLSPLVSGDFNRATRAIKSCYNQTNHELIFGVHVIINSQDDIFIEDIVNFCKESNVEYSITDSDGTPSTGKNSVFDFFKGSDFTHLAQLDGDDMFYPTFLTQVERHLKKYPKTDVLATLPLDIMLPNPTDYTIKIRDEFNALLWGTHYVSNHNWVGAIGRDPIVDGISLPNYARFVLFSKKIVELELYYDKFLIVGEDKKMHFDFLLLHQQDIISYWFTNASDMWICDRTSFGVQKMKSKSLTHITEDVDATQRIREHVNNVLMPDRSAPGEIPIDFPPIYLGYMDKVDFLTKSF